MNHAIKKQKGFTLIELLVVIAIIGLLSSIVLVSLNSARAKARDANRISDLRQIRNAIELYATSNNGNYPSSSGVGKCLGFTSTQTCWLGFITGSDSLINALTPYLSKIPKDPLYGSRTKGNAYVYVDSAGNTAYHCTGASYPTGPFLLWIPDGVVDATSDSVCKSMGFATCCGSATPCTEGWSCAYSLK